MSRRGYKTINLPRELVEWIDEFLNPARRQGRPAPLGIGSRDEFVRIAVAILGAALEPNARNQVPIHLIQRIVAELERRSNPP
ncbi:MAG TPA: hypothetical protein VM327_02940 [Candidatus Thermoplasmatota archaeon]|nr:hypothetical protein [Candidatus Thermoplasmatota archaeon]